LDGAYGCAKCLALKTLATHLARCGSKFKLHCYGFIVARLNSVTSQTPA